MDGNDLVFMGIDVVADALDVAESRRWVRTRAPGGLWRQLGVGTGVVLRHPDAPLYVAFAPADTSFRGVVDLGRERLRVVHDSERFEELVDDSPVALELLQAVLGEDASVAAA